MSLGRPLTLTVLPGSAICWKKDNRCCCERDAESELQHSNTEISQSKRNMVKGHQHDNNKSQSPFKIVIVSDNHKKTPPLQIERETYLTKYHPLLGVTSTLHQHTQKFPFELLLSLFHSSILSCLF